MEETTTDKGDNPDSIVCTGDYFEHCPWHRPLFHIKDTPVKQTGVDSTEDKYAKQTVPACLQIAPSAIRNAGLGIWTTRLIPARSFFGPYRGVTRLQPRVESFGWQIATNEEGTQARYIDASDPNDSNWMRYMKCARNYQEQNVIAYKQNRNIYYSVLHEICADSELYVFYGRTNASELGIDVLHYFEEPEKPLSVVIFSCDQCDRSFASPIRRDHHSWQCCQTVLRSSEKAKNELLIPNGTNVLGVVSCTGNDTKSPIEVSCHPELQHLVGCPSDDLLLKKDIPNSYNECGPRVQLSRFVNIDTCTDVNENVITIIGSKKSESLVGVSKHKDVQSQYFTVMDNTLPPSDLVTGKSDMNKFTSTLQVESPKQEMNANQTSRTAGTNGEIQTNSRYPEIIHRTNILKPTYSCDLCNKECKTTASLAQHKWSHVKTRLIACSQCAKKFKRLSDLHCHIRVVHKTD